MTKPISHWSGLDLTPLPYESFSSVLQLFAWRNALDRKTLRSNFREGRSRRLLNIGRLAEETYGDIMETRYQEEELARSDGTWQHPRFRFCPICLEACYHSWLFQCIQLAQCPIHGVALTDCCQACGARVPGRWERDVFFERPYECDFCHRPYGGAAPTLEAHLVLRANQTILTERLQPYALWWDTQSNARGEISAMRYIKRLSVHERWGPVEDLLRSLMDQADPELRCLRSAGPWPSTIRLRWRYRAQLYRPYEQLYLRGFREVPVRFAHLETTMYRSTLKQILQWLRLRTGLTEAEVLDAVAHLDEDHSKDMPPELLAFGVLRLQIECGWLPDLFAGPVRIEDARPQEGRWRLFEAYDGRVPRIAWRGAILALYAAWCHIARRSSHAAAWRFIRIQPKPQHLVLVRSELRCRIDGEWLPGNFQHAEEAWYHGEVAFLGVPGLALFPRISRSARQRQPPPWRPREGES